MNGPILPGSTADIEEQRKQAALRDRRLRTFVSTEVLDDFLRALERVGVTPWALQAYYHAKALPNDMKETLTECDAETAEGYTVHNELENQRDAELDGARDFVYYYFDDVEQALLFIEETGA